MESQSPLSEPALSSAAPEQLAQAALLEVDSWQRVPQLRGSGGSTLGMRQAQAPFLCSWQETVGLLQ